MAANFGVDIDAFNLDKPRLAIGKTGARDGAFTLFRNHGQLDIGVKCARFFLPRGGYLHAAFFGHHGGGNHVHIGVGRPHDACDGGAVQRGEVHVGHRTIVKHVDRLDRLVRHLAHECTKVAREFQPRAHDGGFFGSHRRHVQRVLHGPGQQVI